MLDVCARKLPTSFHEPSKVWRYLGKHLYEQNLRLDIELFKFPRKFHFLHMCLRTSWEVMNSNPPFHPFVILLSADDRFWVGFITLGWIVYRHYIQSCFVRVFGWVFVVCFVRFHFKVTLGVPYGSPK